MYLRHLQFDKHVTLVLGWWNNHNPLDLKKSFLSKFVWHSPASISPIICLVVWSSHRPTPTLPDGAFDTCPDRAFGSLRGLYVAPVQPSVGDLVLGLRVGLCTVFGTRHNHGEGASLRLKLDNVELLLVGQCLVGFLQGGGRRIAEFKLIDSPG